MRFSERNNWGTRYLADDDGNEFPRDAATVLLPGGVWVRVLWRTEHGSVYDMGHTRTTVSRIPYLVTTAHGINFFAPVAGVEIERVKACLEAS